MSNGTRPPPRQSENERYWRGRLQSPQVQDTLRQLVGRLPAFRISETPQRRPARGMFIPMAYDPGSDTVHIYADSRDDDPRFLRHEFGHVLDNRDPTVRERMLGRADALPGTSTEAFADAFAQALDALARNDTTNTTPDVAILVRHLAKRPPFKRDTTP